ncbi:MAG: outer membrane lipoprotein carrier protein LolA [Proteobacteria bacterium]|nr:outer membrane lipoprotein carrier protein LolA [Pseudomonadota bacterium]MBU1232983.1 outer membrane lipoprotein carrier protein LolA [Pseudomonadota bacterium]MBU1420114.1 outer membrane lipoprotein carrier protein LolA [Pseudomonadota bacterium]MBU1455256.1 outer membrane lipoprotein carrier protein LolA [Pseudomonadota bacterium]
MRSLLIVLFLCAGLGYFHQGQAVELTGRSPVRVESVQTEFTQEKHLPILVRPIISKGTFVFQAPGSLRWEYLAPIHSVLLLHDGRIRKFIEQNGKFVEESGMGVDSMQIILQEITGWLDGNIADTPTFHATVQENGIILLTPKEPALAKIISRIELRLADQSGLMESVVLYEGADSLTKLIFAHAVLNAKIPAVTFTQP